MDRQEKGEQKNILHATSSWTYKYKAQKDTSEFDEMKNKFSS